MCTKGWPSLALLPSTVEVPPWQNRSGLPRLVGAMRALKLPHLTGPLSLHINDNMRIDPIDFRPLRVVLFGHVEIQRRVNGGDAAASMENPIKTAKLLSFKQFFSGQALWSIS